MHGNWVGADWVGGHLTTNSDAPRYRGVRAVDHWDELGRRHDLALADAEDREELLAADAAYAMGALSDGASELNPVEFLTGVAVGTVGVIAHQWSGA